MPKNILTTNQYSKLVTDLNNLISQTKTKIETFARSQSLITYWEVGKRIVKEDLTNNANYFTLILEDLSGALEMDKNTLTRCVQFFKTYPVKPSVSNLTWSHYKNLISVNDSSLRLELEDREKKLSWNVSQLSKVIQQAKTNNNTLNITSKIKRPLQPNYLYKATIVNVIDGDTLLLNVDLGFKV
jgi:chaperonin cofactor prefoldin